MLSYRQKRVMRDTVNIYKPAVLSRRADGSTRDMQWDPTPAYTNVLCHWEPKPDTTVAGQQVGRYPEDNIFTQDHFHFAWQVEVNGAWVDLTFGGQCIIEVTTAGHPEAGSMFETTGETTKLLRSKDQYVMGKKIPKPLGLA